jgi:hypothetical protein
MTRTRIFQLLIATAPVAACAPIYESRYPYDAGWREATVTDVAPGDELLVAATVDCRLGLPAKEVVSGRFARVTYYNARQVRSMIVPVDAVEAPQPGMKAYVNPDDCGQPMHTARR